MNLRLGFITVVLAAVNMNAQEWVSKMKDPNANYYDVKQSFDDYWLVNDRKEKGKGYKVFRRWENFVERRVYPSGQLSQLSQTAENYRKFYEAYQAAQSSGKVIGGGTHMLASATWTPMGPHGPLSGTGQGQFLKSGRLNFITLDPTNSSNLWVGAPAGGLWKSTNGGVSWTTNTDNLSVIGCSDLAIDPNNTTIMYLATGDGDGGDTPCIGVLKSTDGGNSWVNTGLTFNKSQNVEMRRLIINPANTQILIAATNQGIYRTLNGGAIWTLVATGNTHDLEFKPGDPNTVYAGGAVFRRSVNGGASFSTINTGIPTTGVNRMAVAVTSADPNYVYVLASKSSGSGFQGLYRSVNSGAGFTAQSTTPNLLGWSSTGSDSNGQGWYDLCVAASPLNKDEVVVGGVNVWRSVNGGTSWTLYGHWTGSGAPFTHADHHDLEYSATGALYNCNDGTVYRRTTTNWQEISGNMNISQIYRIGLSSVTPNYWITGHQDNGTSIWNGTTYNAELGGDGMDCFIDRTTNNNVFAEYYDGDLMRSTNGGINWNSCVSGLTGTAPWVTIWKQDPQVANTLYCGYSNLFKSTNLAGSWTQLAALPAGGTIREFAIAKSNNLVIYVLKSNGIYKTVNGGASWTTVTGSVPVGSALPEYICIDPLDANKAWVVLSGYSSGNKVFRTTNGGASWTNYTANLPNIPGNCILYEAGTNDRVYVGMDVGIYYRDNGSANWTLYNTSLPNVPISELEISPANPSLLYASTYGRGVWVASVVASNVPPVSQFSAPSSLCNATPIIVNDQSPGSPTSWSWSVTPSTGVSVASYTSQNLMVNFSATGTYTLKLQTSNLNGPGTIHSQVVTVYASPVIAVSVSSLNVCGGSPATFTATGAATYTWSHFGGNQAAAMFFPNANTVYTISGTQNGCIGKNTVNVVVSAPSAIQLSGDTMVCAGSPAGIMASGATGFSWSTGDQGNLVTVTPTVTTVYTATGTNGPCKTQANFTVEVLPLPSMMTWSDRPVACENDPVTFFAFGASQYIWEPGSHTGDSVQVLAAPGVTYQVTGTDDFGCAATVETILEVDACVSVGENVGEKGFAVFPNPANAFVLVRGFNGKDDHTLSLSDISGRVLISQGVKRGMENAVINLQNIPAGIYVLTAEGPSEARRSVKLIIE